MKEFGRYTFVVAVDARVQLVRNFEAMGAVVGRSTTHDGDSKLMIILVYI